MVKLTAMHLIGLYRFTCFMVLINSGYLLNFRYAQPLAGVLMKNQLIERR